MDASFWRYVLEECRDGLDAALHDLNTGVKHDRVDEVLDDVVFQVDRVRVYVSLVAESMENGRPVF